MSPPFLGCLDPIFLYLQITRTGINCRTSSNFGQIGPLTTDLAALRSRKFPIDWCLHASSFIFDRIVIKVAGNQDRHKSSDEFDFGLLVSLAHLYVFWNEIWSWHIELRWAIVALWATCFDFRCSGMSKIPAFLTRLILILNYIDFLWNFEIYMIWTFLGQLQNMHKSYYRN